MDKKEKESSLEEGLAVSNFIRDIIDEDLKSGKRTSIMTRFPPEPNGYLHIGHAKSICINFGIARDYNGVCNLRFDDSNPCTEETEYVESIKEDVHWLGFDWGDREYFASDYFDYLFELAVKMIKEGKAYVCDLNADEVREYRGTLTEAGRESPYRNRSVEENLDLFMRMKNGEFPDGTCLLRAKIDMASPNLNMRDPAMYRIRHAHHHRTGDKWCIYPMYDYTHGLSDSKEGITHSICTLEFEDHRPLYDWYLEATGVEHRPQQIEFARLNISYTVLSKRKLLELVRGKYVTGWDDPRMPTISGLRRRGYTPEAIRDFCDRIGVAKADSIVDLALLDFCQRDHLNKTAERRQVVLRPIKLIIDNYPPDQVEMFAAENNPEDPQSGTHQVPFSRELYIEEEDFAEVPPKKWLRLTPGQEVRLKYAYYVTCTSVVKDSDGKIVEIHCDYDPKSRGGWSDDGRKVKGTLHWVSVQHAVDVEVRLYDTLFAKINPSEVEEGGDYKDNLNPNSLEVLQGCKAEPILSEAVKGERFQFLRNGYFIVDTKDSTADHLVFNRTVGLKDSWAKIAKN
ncbi:MAG: glutamine--tRNA ligase/YqeY domain fusion protein [Bdellovibrionota bacterium]|jgi:glutaminyl-tRNA synthetase